MAVLGVWGGVAHFDSNHQLKVVSGKSIVSTFPSILSSNGLRFETSETVPVNNGGEKSVGFKISSSDLKFSLIDGQLGKFESGGLKFSGGLRVISKNGSINIDGFSITPNKSINNGLQLVSGEGKEAFTVFDLSHPRNYFESKAMRLTVGDMDMHISVPCAQKLGKPELAGTLVGTLSVEMDAETVDGSTLEQPAAPSPALAEGPIDVAISSMGSLTVLGRVGSYPNGRNGLSMSTTSCNVGTQNIPWYQPMDTRHPVIAMNLYRIKDGKFEQVGWSWLKHGFFATNSPGCGSCNSPGTGSLLGPGCSDTYGTGNNGDRRYLGGRDEVNPFTGVWTCQNSYFSNYQNDCSRRNDGAGLDAVAHRLEVADADMGNAGAEYFYEAYYINQNESTDKYNNVASRKATMSWSGSAWSVQTVDSQQAMGPALNRWGDARVTATPRTEGDVIVAVKTTDLGAGMYRYDYTVYNHDLDRQVREFSVPVPGNATVQNIEFRDIDKDASNQWSSSFADEKITWSTGTFGSSTANPLKYSSVFNFRFETNVPPSQGSVKLGLFKPGSGTELSAGIKAPLFLATPLEFAVTNGNLLSGDLSSLAVSDDSRLKLSPTSAGSRDGTGITGSGRVTGGSVSSLTLGVESNNTITSGPGGTQTMFLWNWTTSAWELVDSRATTLADSRAIVTITSGASRFVNSSDGEVRFKIMHVSNAGVTSNRWSMEIDEVGVQGN